MTDETQRVTAAELRAFVERYERAEEQAVLEMYLEAVVVG